MLESGIININKPSGITSHDVVFKLRRKLGIKKVGHTGTLDPLAQGVLPICFGKATRIIEYYEADMKSYHATMQLGTTTTTLDTEGEVIETRSFGHVTEELLLETARQFDGHVMQTPPIYSALKVNGRKLYEYAREGKEVEIQAREVFLKDMNITSIDLEAGLVEFDITCSKGTYIRTIIDDFGKSLGCGAMMTALVRTRSGAFALENAVTLDDVLAMTPEEIEECVIAPETTLTGLGTIELDPKRHKAFRNGMSSHPWGYRITENEGLLPEYKVYCEESFLGIGCIREEELVPVKVII